MMLIISWTVMRYSKEHKAETRARIVRKASVCLREKGTRGVGVADLMKEAGLTHGGFYAHFNSREALLVEAVADAMDRSIARWRKNAAELPEDERLAAIVEAYLTPDHCDAPGRGCAVAALGAEIAREGDKAREMFADKLDEMIGTLAEQIPGKPAAEARSEAIASLALMAGALILARGAGGGAFSAEVLAACRKAALKNCPASAEEAPAATKTGGDGADDTAGA